MRNPTEIEFVKFRQEELELLAGKYKLNDEIPGIGEQLIRLTVKEDKIFVEDLTNGDDNLLSAITKTEFVDLNTGLRAEFQITRNPLGLLWGGSYQFNKVEN